MFEPKFISEIKLINKTYEEINRLSACSYGNKRAGVAGSEQANPRPGCR